MKPKYDLIGDNYNATRKADGYIASKLRQYLDPTIDGYYLDIGCGTGSYTDRISGKRFEFVGIDPSGKMLSEAKRNHSYIEWRKGTAEQTDLPDDSITGIVASLTIHHWDDLYLGLKEMNRVLVKNGRIVIFTATNDQMTNYWLVHYFPKMMSDSIKQMPSYPAILDALSNCNFELVSTENYFVRQDLEDKFLFCGKNDPKMYLDESIRKGISSFSALANADEVEKGLISLREDIQSGKIKEIVGQYDQSLGDYVFITAQKV